MEFTFIYLKALFSTWRQISLDPTEMRQLVNMNLYSNIVYSEDKCGFMLAYFPFGFLVLFFFLSDSVLYFYHVVCFIK